MNAVLTERESGRNWRETLSALADPRMLVILLMGFASGLPLLLTLSTLSYWLSILGIDKTSIGLFALVGLPYSFKFLWAPVVDHLRLPLLGRRFGQRRSWALLAQAGLILAIAGLAVSDPSRAPFTTALAALAIAFFSATQDIVVDAYRIEILDDSEQGLGASATQLGYRFGLLASGAGALALSDFVSWPWVFAAMAGLVLVGTATVLAAREPAHPKVAREELRNWKAWLRRAAIEPFREFLSRRGALVILAFVLLYKFGDAIGGVMANPFYREMGFSGVEIASVTKVFGLVATLVGIVLGGLFVTRFGVMAALIVGGVLQAVTNLLFSWLALVGHSLPHLTLAIAADNLAGGLGSAAFVAYLSQLCNRAFTATQFALLTSLMAAGRTLLSSGGGWLADQMDWASFFALTAGLAIPGLLLLLRIMRLYPTRKEAAP